MVGYVAYARCLGRLVSVHEDGSSEGHSLRLEQLTWSVLEGLSAAYAARGRTLPADADLWPAAMLTHDVGKLLIPSELLRRPGPLGEEERLLVQTHAVLGEETLCLLANEFDDQEAHHFWRIATLIAGGHHERPDGCGYPLGLSDVAVPLVLRVARLVDVYDALTSRRAYREALLPGRALQMMQDDIGGFEPELLHVLEAVVEERLQPRLDSQGDQMDPPEPTLSASELARYATSVSQLK